MLPLYEAKMIHHFDHRWATYEPDGTIRDVTLAEKQDPDFAAMPRYWVREEVVRDRLADRWNHDWLLGWRDICRSTDERTVIASSFPHSAVGNNLPIAVASPDCGSSAHCLGACLTSFVLDYLARPKVGGTHLNFFVSEQLPVLPPDAFEAPCPWEPARNLSDWIRDRVLELTYTSQNMAPYARALGHDGPPFKWDSDRRALVRAELDACFFHLYGLTRDEVDYIMDTFPIVRRKDEAASGDYRTKRLVLDSYDTLAADTAQLS